jgi:hypothetical protein
MERNVKCLLLKIDTILITEIVEVGSELGEPDCKLINPYQFFGVDDLLPWKEEVTNQTEFMIHSDSILTIADPTPEIVEKYLELTA